MTTEATDDHGRDPIEERGATVAALRAEVERLRDTVRGHEQMHWPEEAHRLQQQRNAALRRAEAAEAKLRKVEALHHKVECGCDYGDAREAEHVKCSECGWHWPCETSAVLARSQTPA